MTSRETFHTWRNWLTQITDPDSRWGCLLLPAGILTFLGLMTLPLIAIVLFIALQAAASAPASPPPEATAAIVAAATTTVIPPLPSATPVLPTETPAPAADLPAYAPEAVAAGQAAYASLCTACHGPDARGLPNLGKDLVDSEFVRGLSDRELQQFIITGRPIWDAANTTGVDMPPRGGNPALSNEDILKIIAYLRVISGQGVFAEAAAAGAAQAVPTATAMPLPTATLPAPTSALPTATTASAPASGGEAAGNYDPAVIAAGQAAYASLCTACHGPDARGLPNLGKDLVDSEFVRSLSDRELQQFIITGRPIWDAANTTGVDMPPRGGNPALSNEDILKIIAYLRSLQSAP